MTDPVTDKAPLPPIAWQRETGWGRDVTAYAREQDHRISDQHVIDAFEISSPHMSTVEAIVITSRYRTIFGSVASASFLKSRTLTADEWDQMIVGRYHEIDIATAITTFIMEGSRIISMGPKLVAQLESDPSADLAVSALSKGGPSFYVHAEGNQSRSYDGQPLDGFLISFEDEDEDEQGHKHLHITPMTRGKPVINQPRTPTPTLCLSPDDGDVTISDTLRNAARKSREAVEKGLAKVGMIEPEEELTLLEERRRVVMLQEMEEVRKQADVIDAEANRWARIIGMALNCLVNRGPEAVSCFPNDAPSDLVSHVEKGGVGARKAEQRLVASGYPRWTRYEMGETAARPMVEMTKAVPPTANSTTVPVKPETQQAAPISPVAAPPKADRRKERRLERQALTTVPKTIPVETGKKAQAVAANDEPPPKNNTNGATFVWTTAIVKHDEQLLEAFADVLRRCFKDLPSLDSRNWENAFPPALAAMIMRRTRVAQMPRENVDGTRRRLAADIRPRLEGLPTLLHRLRAEEAANGSRLRAYEIERSSIARDIDDDVVDAAAHPILVSITGDDNLAQRIQFAGVERETNYVQDRTVLVRAWRVERTLHLMGITFDGCLSGFRRVEYDLDDRTVTTFDSEGDDGDVDGLLDALYAPIADVVLGPVDESEAWRHERRLKASRDRVAPAVPTTDETPSQQDHDKDIAVLPWIPEDAEFSSWDAVRQPCHGLAAAQAALVSDIMDRNAVSRAVLRTLDHEGDARDVRHALTRHLASWSKDIRVDVLVTPDIQDDVSLDKLDGADGMLIVTDVALVEHASPGLVTGPATSREAPLCILYRIRSGSVASLVIRPTADNLINLAQWTRFDAESTDDESDLDWYVRGAIATALIERTVPASVPKGLTTLPARMRADARAPGHREGPRRIVAQARVRPENMRLAAVAASNWFDDQAARHGDALIEDRRTEGDWTIENESNDQGVSARWSVTLHVADDEPGALDIIVRTTLATGVKPRLPTLVRDIAAATPTTGPDGRLLLNPRSVRTRSELNELLRHLQSQDRQLPTLVMTQDRSGQYARDPSEVARQSLGAMNVWLIADHMTYELSDTLGQEYRTFGGAARLFQPRFDPDIDPAARHPRLMNDTGVKRTLDDLISRVSAATITRYNIPDPLSSTARVIEVEVASDEPTLPFVTDAATGREAFHAPTATLPNETSPTSVENDAGVGDEQPIGFVPEQARETPPPERRSKEDQAASTNSSETIESAPAEETASETKPKAIESPVDRKKPEVTATDPVMGTGADIGEIVHAVDAALARRLGELGIGGLVGAVATLVDRVNALTEMGGVRAQNANVEARNAEIQHLREEMRIERETAQELLTEAETQRQASINEVETLRQALNELRRGELRSSDAPQWPSELSGLAEWLEQNVLPNVVITQKAWRAMRKVRYTDMERLCTTLQLLDGAYIDMRAGEEGAKQRWDDGLKTLRLESKKQSQGGKGIRGGAEYRFDHDGLRWEMDFHIRGNESLHNEPDRLLRIYYAYDKERGRVLIGHMPTHLTTIDS